jgi:hypothetical protein
MGLLDDVKGVLAQYAQGSTPAGDPGAHFDQVTSGVSGATLAQAVAAAFRSDQTPPFAQMVSQLFANATPEQRATIVNALLAAAPEGIRSQLGAALPGTGAVSTQQVSAISPDTVQKVASQVEQHDPSVVDKLSAVYAQHPTLVKALGTTAMIVAMRKIAEKYT